MKRVCLLFVLFSITSAAFAQVGTGSIAIAQPFGFTNSVVDQNGNVLIFDETFIGLMGPSAPSPLTSQTHVIVVSSDGKTINGYNYDGTFQILGVGQNAVYAMVNTFTLGAGTGSAGGTVPTMFMPIFTRKLVALHVVAGALPATLPSIDVTSNQEVRLGLAVGANLPDTIALVSGNTFIFPPLLGAGTTSPIAGTPHMVWLYTCDGLKFTPNPNNPISTAGH